MKKIYGVYLIFCLCFFLLNRHSAQGYGYAKEEDPLTKGFKSVILYGRQNDWAKVAAAVKGIDDRIEDVQKIFKVALKQKIDQAVQQKDFQSLANHMANLVFLAIREKFYYNLQEKLEVYIHAKVRLRLAEEYYSGLLAGNVKEYDVRHKTNLDEGVYNGFIKARDTLGSMGFLGAGAVKPDVDKFRTLTREIESLLLKAFPYFEAGEANP